MTKTAIAALVLALSSIALSAPAEATRPVRGVAHGWLNHVMYVGQCDWVPAGPFGLLTPTNCVWVPVKGHQR